MQDRAGDQIVHRLTDEGIPEVILTEKGVPVDDEAAGGSETIDLVVIVQPTQRVAGRIDRTGSGDFRKRYLGGRGADMGIAAEVVIREGKVPSRPRVVAAEPVAPIIPVAAVLGLAGLGIVLAGVRPDAQIAAVHVHTLAALGGSNASRAIAVADVDPMIQPPLEPGRQVLSVSLLKSAEQDLLPVCLTIAIGVFGVDNVGHTDHQHTLFPGHDGVGIGQALEKERGLVVQAVPVQVFEETHAASRPAVNPRGIVGHLHHPHLEIRSPGNVHGIHHQRLCRHQFRLHAGANPDGRQRLVLGDRRRDGLARFGGIKGVGQLPQRLVGDAILAVRRKALGFAVENHGSVHFVTALGVDAPGGDIAGQVIGVGIDPEPIDVKLPLESNGIVHHHLSRQKHHGQVVSEGPCLHGIVHGPRKFLPLFQLRQHQLGKVRPIAVFIGTPFPLFPGRQGVKVEFNIIEASLRRMVEGLEIRLQQTFHFLRQLLAMLLRVLQFAAWMGIGVRPATDRDERLGARMLCLDHFLRKTRPVAMDPIEAAAQGGAMAGVAGQHRQEMALGVRDPHHRQRMIHRSVRLHTKTGPLAVLEDATIRRETHLPLSPVQMARPAIFQCLQSHHLQLVQ